MDDLERFDCEQNSPEWYASRAGIPTASEFDTVMARGRGGGESVGRRKYMLRLIGERITGQVVDGYTNAHMERGHALEPEARDLYALVKDANVEQVGFLRRCGAGASPDSLVDTDGLLEIKTKVPHLQIECLLSNQVPAEHLKQLHGQLWISGRAWCDFVSYWPGLPLFVKRVERDEALIARIAIEVREFLDEMAELEARVRAMTA